MCPVIVTSTTQSSNRLDQFLSSFFAVNTYTPVEVIIPIEVANPGNRRDIVLKYATKAFIRPVMYTGNQPVAAVANLCASKARYPILFFASDQIKNAGDALARSLTAPEDSKSVVVGKRLSDDNDLLHKNMETPVLHPYDAYGETVTAPAATNSFILCRKYDFDKLGGYFAVCEQGIKNNALKDTEVNRYSVQITDDQITGSIDQVQSDVLYGWIANKKKNSAVLDAHIYIDENFIGSTKANLYRKDILKNDISSGQHGFKFKIPYIYLDGKEHQIKIQARHNQNISDVFVANVIMPCMLPLPENIHKLPFKLTDNPKVSIVVPAYNVEDFLPEALLSLIEQTLKDIEIIIINDGSTDKTTDICQYYCSIDDRIRYIDLLKNQGYGHACNIGIKAARGQYLAILEPDDFVDRDTYRHAYEQGIKHDLDWVRFGFVFYNEGQSRPSSYFNVLNQHKVPLNQVTDINKFLGIYPSQPTVWGFLYKRKFLHDNNILFLETPGASYQDNSFWYKNLSLSKKVMLLDRVCYYYRQHPGQSVHNVTKVNAPIVELEEMRNFCNSVLKEKLSEILYRALFLQFINRAIDYFELHFKRLRLDLKSEFYENYKIFIDKTLFQNKNFELYYSKLIERRKKILTDVKNAKTYNDYIYNQNMYQANGELIPFDSPKMLDQVLPIARITPVFQNMFFGYFDIKSWDTKCRNYLALKVPFMDRLPNSNDIADICVINENGTINVIQQTNCWNFQQGNLLQFIPTSDENIIYNFYDKENNSYASQIYNLNQNKMVRKLSIPIANISPKGGQSCQY